jgi:hypothetical protein
MTVTLDLPRAELRRNHACLFHDDAALGRGNDDAPTGPSLSPDGSQVAFSWNGSAQDNQDIYIKLVFRIQQGGRDRLVQDARDWWPC